MSRLSSTEAKNAVEIREIVAMKFHDLFSMKQGLKDDRHENVSRNLQRQRRTPKKVSYYLQPL